MHLNNFAWAGEWAAPYAIAAYNAGSNAVNSFGGIPPCEETINHVNSIGEIYNELISNAPKELIG